MICFLNILIISLIISCVYSQQINIVQTTQFIKPTDCNNLTQYYDIARLQCVNCPENSFPSDCNLFKNFILFFRFKSFNFLFLKYTTVNAQKSIIFRVIMVEVK
jgi:hypothetical protein